MAISGRKKRGTKIGPPEATSFQTVARMIWLEVGSEAAVEFIRRFVFCALIGNDDMHIKNWSLIYSDRRKPKLSPAYDILSTLPYQPSHQLALTFLDSRDYSTLTMAGFKRFAELTEIPESLVINTVKETLERFNEAWKKSYELPLDSTLRSLITYQLATLGIEG